MTPTSSEALAAVLAQTWPVLLDFDGPVCPIFAGGRNAAIAGRMRHTLGGEGVDVPDEVAATVDPLDVLWFAHKLGRADLTHRVEDTFIAGEIEAAREGAPTPGAHDAIRACHEVGRPIIIVSNNSEQSIRTYLEHHGLSELIQAIIGRTPARPDLMKPHPDPVHRALRLLDDQQRPVLIGDSLTDVEVARTTGVHSIGYVKAPERLPGLVNAGAHAVTDSMAAIAEAVRISRPTS